MHFQAEQGRTRSMEREPPFLDPLAEIDTDRARIGGHSILRFFKGKIQTTPPAFASGFSETGGDRGFAGAGRSRKQDAAAAIETLAAEHRIEALDAAGNALRGSFVLISQRSDGQNRKTVFINQEGILVGSVGRAAIFDNPQPPGGNLLVDAMVQQNDAIRNVF